MAALPPGVAALTFRKPATPAPHSRWLSATGDVREAARSLFAVMRSLDREGFKAITAEPAPDDGGLGTAINDRLRRAAGRGQGTA